MQKNATLNSNIKQIFIHFTPQNHFCNFNERAFQHCLHPEHSECKRNKDGEERQEKCEKT